MARSMAVFARGTPGERQAQAPSDKRSPGFRPLPPPINLVIPNKNPTLSKPRFPVYQGEGDNSGSGYGGAVAASELVLNPRSLMQAGRWCCPTQGQ